MAGNTETISTDVLWGGGQSPFSVTYGKMMMWFFLVSDALTFGGLLTAYGFARATSEDAWPIGEQAFRALPGLDGSIPTHLRGLDDIHPHRLFRDDGVGR